MLDDDPDFIIRNIPASVVSDIERLDEAMALVSDLEDEELAEKLFDVLGDVRSSMLYLAEKHDKLVVQMQELTP